MTAISLKPKAAKVKISQRIAKVAVAKPDAAANETPWTPADDNPLEKRIERRPDGVLPSETNKIEFFTQEGKRRIYITVSYAPVCGFLAGEEVCIERPLEFFIPAGQTSEDPQWLSATMRSLSLAARGGFVAKALADLRKVAWTKGPVRYGATRAGKPRYHDSEVAAIAWGIEQMLHERGFLDEKGNIYPLEKLVHRYQARQSHVVVDEAVTIQEAVPGHQQPIAGICPDADCGGDMINIDNCPTCLNCGYSKCG